MKRITTFILAAICYSISFGQNKQSVAVYVAGNSSEDLKKAASSQIVARILQSGNYTATDRTTDFFFELMRERYFLLFNKVDDGQIIKIGKHSGANLVCMISIREQLNKTYKTVDYQFTIRLIDTEAGSLRSISSLSVQGEADYKNDERYNRYSGKLKVEAIVPLIDNLTIELLQHVTSVSGKPKAGLYVTRSLSPFDDNATRTQLLQQLIREDVYAVADRTSDFYSPVEIKMEDNQLISRGQQLGLDRIFVLDDLDANPTDIRMITITNQIATSTTPGSPPEIYNRDEIDIEYENQIVPLETERVPIETQIVPLETERVPIEAQVVPIETQVIPIAPVTANAVQASEQKVEKIKMMVTYADADISILRSKIIRQPDAICPSGWRLPTKDEFEFMWTAENRPKNLSTYADYVTYPQTAAVDGHQYTTVWEWDAYNNKFKEYCLFEDGKRCKKKNQLHYHDFTKYRVQARCVK
jgi:hypothetical protein